MKKVLIGGLVAGVIVFVWGMVSHMMLPLGRMGISRLPAEGPVLAAMESAIPEAGLYFFPGMDMSRKPTEAETKAWQARYSAGPWGILVYNPAGVDPLSPKRLGVQFGGSIVAGIVAALVLSVCSGPYGKRALVPALLALFGWIVISVPYWNWYGFPGDFTLAVVIDGVVGWLLAGPALAAVIKPAKG